MRFARETRTIAVVGALVILLSGCQSQVSADTIVSGRIIPLSTSAPLDGEFVVEDGCVNVQLHEGGETYPVIWPEGSEVSAEDSNRITLLNGSVSLNQAPQDFRIAVVETASLAGEVQIGAIDGWDRCVTEADKSVIVLTAVGGILLPQ